MSEEAVIAEKSPFAVELVEGKTYYWCACGRSKNQPFCDGSHQGTAFEPVAFTAEKTGTAYLCGCKRTANRPFCDGTHNTL
jgi:CDGSH-type Zn-finger protein